MRAFRLDKMTLAALEATLRLYLNEERALREVPVLRMLGAPLEELRQRAEALAERLRAIPALAAVQVAKDVAYVGGGSLPDQAMTTWVVEVKADGLERRRVGPAAADGDAGGDGRGCATAGWCWTCGRCFRSRRRGWWRRCEGRWGRVRVSGFSCRRCTGTGVCRKLYCALGAWKPRWWAVIVAKKVPFSLIYAPVVYKHFGAIDAKYDSLIHEKIEEQLTHEPDLVTRNRKPVRPPAAFQAEWELRFGPNNRFRVFYQIDREAHAVRVVAVGVEDRNRLLIAGEEVAL